MDDRATQSPGAMARHRDGGGLLQCFVGEQPPRRIGELRGGAPSQQGRLDEGGGVIAETRANRVDVGDAGAVVEGEAVDLGQCVGARVTGEVRDVGGGEDQDGLTPVIITL